MDITTLHFIHPHMKFMKYLYYELNYSKTKVSLMQSVETLNKRAIIVTNLITPPLVIDRA
jgi:hypothetical protein